MSPSLVSSPARFNGPARSGNGGFDARVALRRAGAGPTRAAGRGDAARPAAPRHRDERHRPRTASPPLAGGRPGPVAHGQSVDLEARRPVDRGRADVAAEAMLRYPGAGQPPVPHLLRLRPGPRRGRRAADLPRPGRRLVDDRGRVASLWVPAPRARRVRRPDRRRGRCGRARPGPRSTASAAGRRTSRAGPCVLGRMTARVDAFPAWASRTSWSAGTSRPRAASPSPPARLYDADGRVVATARHTWIQVDPSVFNWSPDGPARPVPFDTIPLPALQLERANQLDPEPVVARRRLLPDLRPQLRRRQRRRRRRPGRHPRSGCPTSPTSASTRSGSRRSTPRRRHDHGYDVADYRDVDPLFGTLADFDAMLADGHDLGIRVIVDVVPNHTSSEHPWFQAALAAAPGSPERDRYVFRDGTGRDGASRRTTGTSIFGGPAWTRRRATAQWYLHLFDAEQPDLNWRNPEVQRRVRRRSCASGSTAASTASGSTWRTGSTSDADLVADGQRHQLAAGTRCWDQPEVHEVYRRWRTRARRVRRRPDGRRRGLGRHAGDDGALRPPATSSSRPSTSTWLEAPWSAAAFREVDRGDATTPSACVDGIADLGAVQPRRGPRASPATAAGRSGCARAQAAALTMLALPGSAYVYQGEELGLPAGRRARTSRAGPGLRSAAPSPRAATAAGCRCRGRAPRRPTASARTGASRWLPMPADWAAPHRRGPGPTTPRRCTSSGGCSGCGAR